MNIFFALGNWMGLGKPMQPCWKHHQEEHHIDILPLNMESEAHLPHSFHFGSGNKESEDSFVRKRALVSESEPSDWMGANDIYLRKTTNYNIVEVVNEIYSFFSTRTRTKPERRARRAVEHKQTSNHASAQAKIKQATLKQANKSPLLAEKKREDERSRRTPSVRPIPSLFLHRPL